MCYYLCSEKCERVQAGAVEVGNVYSMGRYLPSGGFVADVCVVILFGGVARLIINQHTCGNTCVLCVVVTLVQPSAEECTRMR